MLTYTTRLVASPEDLAALKQVLVWERDVFNEASKAQFPEKKRSIVVLHSKVYAAVRKSRPEIPSGVVVRAEHACLSAYRTVRKNRHELETAIEKRALSIRLDSNLYSKRGKRFATANRTSVRIKTSQGRKTFGFALYPRLEEMLERHPYADPLVFEREGELWIALSFDVASDRKVKQSLALGVDMGCRVTAATSDGRLIMDKQFAKEQRRLRYLKRELKRAKGQGSNSAKRHLKKLRRKEANKNRNQTHHVANAILKTEADTIVLENLKSIKVKKHRGQNKNRISQVPLYELRRIITYKAGHMGKHVMLVCPAYTSQTDCLTGKRDGARRGRRYYAKSGLVYDSDINAAVNIAKLSKLPVSQGNLLDGQAVVTRPIVQSIKPQGSATGQPAREVTMSKNL